MLNKILLLLLLLINFNLQASTPSECASRASQTYESTNGSEYEKSSAGSRVASECFKEFSKSSNDDKSFSGFAWIAIISVSILLIYFAYIILNDYFRNATVDEMKNLLNRDMINNKQLPVTEKILAIQKQKKAYLHSRLDSAIAGKNTFKWKELEHLEEVNRYAMYEITDLGIREKAIIDYKNKNPLTMKCPFCAEKVIIDAIKCKHCLSDLRVN
jgi:hypothetical protein